MIKKILSKFTNPIVGNTMWIISSNVFQMTASLIVGLLTARYLGPSKYGVLNYVGSIIAIFLPITSLGLQGVVISRLVKGPNEAGTILGSSFVLQIISSIISLISALILIIILNPNFEFLIIISIMQGASLVFRTFEIIDYWFQSNLQSRNTAIAKIISTVIISLYRLFIIYQEKNIIWFAVTILIETFFYGVILSIFYIKQNGPRLKARINMMISLLSESYHFIVSGIMVLIYTQIDKLMLGNYFNEELVGIYSAAVHVTEMWIFFPTSLIISLRPIIIKYKNLNKTNKYLNMLFSLYNVIFWTSTLIAIIVTIFSTQIVYLLYGADYLAGSNSLSILIWATSIAMLGNARGVWILAENKNKYVKIYLIWGLCSNITLNFLLIPRFGMEGAAFATLLTQIVSVYISPLFYKETRVHTYYLMKSINPKYLFETLRGE